MVSRKVKLALPCIGADALGMGLKEMQWSAAEIAYAWDVDPSLLPLLLAAHGPIGLGGLSSGVGHGGDILAFEVASMQRVDFLVSGPPCPPFSSIGLRGGACADDREKVFRKVTEMIAHQGRLGAYGFILEMVPGILNSRPHQLGHHNYYDEWLCHLQSVAPMFRVHTWQLQSSDYLPQHRLRLYTVGIHRALAPRHGLVPPSPLRQFADRVDLEDLLHQGLCPIDEGVLTPQQRVNLSVIKQQLVSEPTGPGGSISCFAVDRDPHKLWCSSIRHGFVGTLRTHDELVWLFKADAHGRTVLSRCLHPVERFLLQGFRPEVALFFSKADGMRVSGNSFTVPVITHAFHQLLMCCMTSDTFGFPDVPLPLIHRSRESILDLLHRARLLNMERAGVAVLERELTLLSRRR